MGSSSDSLSSSEFKAITFESRFFDYLAFIILNLLVSFFDKRELL